MNRASNSTAAPFAILFLAVSSFKNLVLLVVLFNFQHHFSFKIGIVVECP
ncbi:MAG TPA: hypothetical protein VFX17_03655 [Patescibacteria group bacterium]|nr:hypothetical protein [Patescibacteria group bacterium]